ncbi:MAG: LON peptidase substrate-binding domain-containing protein [Bacteroidetes bacterium]|nr:LON peptidase substrate-binding domain-containing protein [Bacteroidota bacterium]
MKIPIFPLKLVMFPGAKYPLHIFEERYKLLIKYCIENDEGFGIVAASDENPYKVGCFVRISKILKRYENGNLDLTVTGLYRFSLISSEIGDDGYHIGEIEEFSDEIQYEKNDFLNEEAVEKFQIIVRRTDLYLSETFWRNLALSNRKSFKLAEKSGLSLEQQQSILSMKSENSRLDFLVEHFSKVKEYLDRNEFMKDVISGDGYLN